MKSSIKIVIQHLSGQDNYVLTPPGGGWTRVLQTPKHTFSCCKELKQFNTLKLF